MTALRCTICAEVIDHSRAKRKSFAAVTCSDEHYEQFRIIRRAVRRPRGVYVSKRKWARFLKWEASLKQPTPESNGTDGDLLRTAQT